MDKALLLAVPLAIGVLVLNVAYTYVSNASYHSPPMEYRFLYECSSWEGKNLTLEIAGINARLPENISISINGATMECHLMKANIAEADIEAAVMISSTSTFDEVKEETRTIATPTVTKTTAPRITAPTETTTFEETTSQLKALEAHENTSIASQGKAGENLIQRTLITIIGGLLAAAATALAWRMLMS